jgi:hypothetical protein
MIKKIKTRELLEMSLEIKSLQSNRLVKVVDLFKSQGYQIHDGDEISITLMKTFPKGQYDDDGNNAYFVYINEKDGLALKFGATYLHDIKQIVGYKEFKHPFSKEELRSLDAFDYELYPIHMNDTKQDVTDWIHIK